MSLALESGPEQKGNDGVIYELITQRIIQPEHTSASIGVLPLRRSNIQIQGIRAGGGDLEEHVTMSIITPGNAEDPLGEVECAGGHNDRVYAECSVLWLMPVVKGRCVQTSSAIRRQRTAYFSKTVCLSSHGAISAAYSFLFPREWQAS